MESQPQNPEFRINPENFHPCYLTTHLLQVSEQISVGRGPVEFGMPCLELLWQLLDVSGQWSSGYYHPVGVSIYSEIKTKNKGLNKQ